ncbi:MAG: ABC transporter substrate-binding protein [Sulfolobales archaeon]
MGARERILLISLVIVALVVGVVSGYYAPRPTQFTTLTTQIYQTTTSVATVTEYVTTPTLVTTPLTKTYVLTTSLEWPRRVVDALGRVVVIQTPPSRIVSTAPSITETLVSLGLIARIVGVDSYSNYPPGIRDMVKTGRIEDVGGPWNLDIEKIIRLKPDIVFMCKGVSPQERSFAPKLEESGVKTFFLLCDTARDQRDIYADIRTVALIAGVESSAERLIRDIDANISRVTTALSKANATSYRTLLLLGPPSWGLWTGGGNTFTSWLIRSAGGSNIADKYYGWGQLSYEEVLSADPEVIVVVVSHGVNASVLKSDFENTPLTKTTAWRNGRVYLITGSYADAILRPGPRIAVALEVLARVLHPEVFGEVKIPEVVRVLSVERFSVELSETQILCLSRVLSVEVV